MVKKGQPGKIFLIASTEYIKNGLFPSNDDNAGRNPMTKLFHQNRVFTLNIIDYLNGKLDYARMRAKSENFNPLIKLSGGMKSIIKTIGIAGPPLLIIVAGILVLFRRNSRKRLIARVFTTSA